ncbi:hypothetical protein [Candidatus Thiothrix anitrata]|uniref:Uncharacterized protein n=1 Tax=Candidatus Thiothrix anitrata TaxID=2823902 RepID=A0ABX7X3R9_9GAMM|nr:hypothetical protein [Candidatus Thiothrix anitrata]QTR50530.1 hypothetical protein J8380_02875 [Candidatus Thiothrix anitrata]
MLTTKHLVIIVMLMAAGWGCSSQISSPPADTKLAAPSEAEHITAYDIVTAQPIAVDGEKEANSEIVAATDLPCSLAGGCNPIVEENNTFATNSDQTSTEESNGNGGTGGFHQESIYPGMDVDLVQLPTENSVQYVNGIYTSTVKEKDNADLSQKAEFRNVRFHQLNSPSSINTVNAVITDDKSVSGMLEQGFKFKSIEMTQNSSASSVHAMNYLGDKLR